ncbi:MAG: fimbrillin family protein [Candidatus Cryptobacteroides sp.]
MRRYIYIVAAIAMVVACAKKEPPVYTVGEHDNEIVLRVQVGEPEKDVQTKANDTGHTNHLAFKENTMLRMCVEGKWTGHSPENLVKSTSALTVAETGDSKHNGLTGWNPKLFWDDFGTADPANTASGRAEGLTIYGAAVDGLADCPEVNDWEAMGWTLDLDQSGGWESGDLLSSNNVTSGIDGTYKFDQRNNADASNLLVFTHAMAKVTVRLTAADGFPGYETGLENAKFEETPSVTLTGFYNSGTYNIKAKNPQPQTSTVDITPKHIEGGAGNNTAVYDALVFPGNSFNNSDKVLKINADGNIYYVTAAKINEAIAGEDKSFRDGKNYVFNILVKKTEVIVEATVKDWDEPILAQEEAPVIEIDTDFGTAGTAFTGAFDLYRSTVRNKGYDENSTTDGVNLASKYTYSPETGWSNSPAIYWPNHQTHYFFRGVYPAGTEVKVADPDYDYVDVNNVKFEEGTHPSDLMIAMPLTGDATCTHGYEVADNGICATTGKITLNFSHAMSKLEVRLKSSDPSDANYVDLSHTKVEIVGGYNKGRIAMVSGIHLDYVDAEKGGYQLNDAAAESGFQRTTLDAVVPQELSDDVYFKITVYNSTGKDIYTKRVNTIKDSEGSIINEWKPGEHYIYSLKITRSEIYVTATLTDWKTVDSSEDIWM